MTSPNPATPERPAAPEAPVAAVARLLLDPSTGRVRHPRHAGAAVRAGVFVELVIRGEVTGRAWPAAAGLDGRPVSEAGLSSMASSVLGVVGRRRRVLWRRWFNHVEPDLAAATTMLVETGDWHRDEHPRGPLRDVSAGEVLVRAQLIERLFSELEGGLRPDLTPWSQTERAVALLAMGGGLQGARPRPRRALRQLPTLLPSPRGQDGPDAVLHSAVRGALTAIRRQSVIRVLSG